LLGGIAERVVVYVNGEAITVSPSQRAFEVPVALRPGSNTVRAVATGPSQPETDDTITVQYVPPTTGIVLASPSDGFTLGPEDPPVVVVEGQVEDKTIDTVWVVANEQRVPVTTQDGRFRQVLLVSEPLLHLRAEVAADGAPLQQSKTVT